MSLLHVFLQGGGGTMGVETIVMMVAIIAIFYFFMIRPQQKKQKAIQKVRDEMKIGDKVVTAGGIHGKIKEVGDTHFIIEIAENVKIKIEKSSVYAAAEDVAK